MLAWIRRSRSHGTMASRSSGVRKRFPVRLAIVGELEGRTLLGLTILNSSHLRFCEFSSTQPPSVVYMEAAANRIASNLNDNLLAIQASASNTWMANFPNLGTGQLIPRSIISAVPGTVIAELCRRLVVARLIAPWRGRSGRLAIYFGLLDLLSSAGREVLYRQSLPILFLGRIDFV